MSLPPRPEIKKLKAGHHGGINYAEIKAAGLVPEVIIDFSVCTNPFGPPAGVKKLLSTVVIDRYPDSEATELRERLSGKLCMDAGNILVGSGTTELIRLIALTYFNPGDPVLVIEPTFGDYEIACQIAGTRLVKQRTRAEDHFEPGIQDTIRLIQQHGARGVFLCNPNNPTGRYLSREKIEAVLNACRNTLLVLDEAYLAFTSNTWSAADLISQGDVVVLRSMTKDYALAGLRLGYAVASKEIINNLRRVRPPWNVNAVAQKAGVTVLEDDDYLKRCQRRIRQAKRFLVEELRRLGLAPLPSDTNFFLVRVGNAREFRAALLPHGILVRDCTSFGLPEYVRIAPRTMPECQKLINAIQTLNIEGKYNSQEIRKGAL